VPQILGTEKNSQISHEEMLTVSERK